MEPGISGMTNGSVPNPNYRAFDGRWRSRRDAVGFSPFTRSQFPIQIGREVFFEQTAWSRWLARPLEFLAERCNRSRRMARTSLGIALRK